MNNASLILASSTEDIDKTYSNIEAMSSWVNNYGFMIVFSSVILVVAVIAFIVYTKSYAQKQTSETDLLHAERLASIEQNKKMFDLVTDVQTKQVSQLEQMTRVLQDITKEALEVSGQMKNVNRDIAGISKTVVECNVKSDSIVDTVGEILDYTKDNSKTNKEILSRVIKLESMLSSTTGPAVTGE